MHKCSQCGYWSYHVWTCSKGRHYAFHCFTQVSLGKVQCNTIRQYHLTERHLQNIIGTSSRVFASIRWRRSLWIQRVSKDYTLGCSFYSMSFLGLTLKISIHHLALVMESPSPSPSFTYKITHSTHILDYFHSYHFTIVLVLLIYPLSYKNMLHEKVSCAKMGLNWLYRLNVFRME